MQAQAAEFSGYARQPPPLFRATAGPQVGKRSRHSEATADPAAFWEEEFDDWETVFFSAGCKVSHLPACVATEVFCRPEERKKFPSLKSIATKVITQAKRAIYTAICGMISRKRIPVALANTNVATVYIPNGKTIDQYCGS